jgi:hypothetical protein
MFHEVENFPLEALHEQKGLQEKVTKLSKLPAQVHM